MSRCFPYPHDVEYQQDAAIQTAITEFREHAPAYYQWRTFRRALRLMVLIRAIVRDYGFDDLRWRMACVIEDGSIVIEAVRDIRGNVWRCVFHVYDPVKVAPSSTDETGWIISTDPHWLLASGQLDRWNAWSAINWIFYSHIKYGYQKLRYGSWK